MRGAWLAAAMFVMGCSGGADLTAPSRETGVPLHSCLTGTSGTSTKLRSPGRCSEIVRRDSSGQGHSASVVRVELA